MTDTKKAAPNPCRIITPDVRLAFVSLFKPKPRAPGSPDLRFQTAILVPPGTNMQPFADAIKAAMLKKFSKIIPLKDKGNPVRPADQQEYAGYEKGWLVINATSERQPPVVDRAKLPVTDPAIAHAGCWARCVLTAYGWGPNVGGSGISFELNAVQIVRPGADTDPGGARLDGRGKPVNPDEAFEALELADEAPTETPPWNWNG